MSVVFRVKIAAVIREVPVVANRTEPVGVVMSVSVKQGIGRQRNRLISSKQLHLLLSQGYHFTRDLRRQLRRH